MKCKDCTTEGCPYRAYTEEGECFYTPIPITSECAFNWQSFRAEAAKDILCALLNRESTMSMNGKIVTDHKDFIEMAIIDADALIAKLKEKEKEEK